MDPRFFSSTVLLSSYNVTATHNGSLLAFGHIVCVLYLLSTRARTDQITRLQNNVTYTVQAVLLLTLPQCLFYLFIAIFVRTDFPIPIGACSFLKHFASYSAQVSYLAPSGIAVCHHLQLVWMYNPDRVHIALFIALMGIPQIGLAIAFTFFGIPMPNDTCAQLNLYQNPSVTWLTQFYLLFIQPVGIGLQLYNHFYLRRLLGKKNYDRKNHAKYLAEFHATHIMIGHLTVMLAAISLKFSFVILTKYLSDTYVQSGALLKIIDLIPYTMPGWIGLISILGISDSHSAIISYFRCRGNQRVSRAQSANNLSITM